MLNGIGNPTVSIGFRTWVYFNRLVKIRNALRKIALLAIGNPTVSIVFCTWIYFNSLGIVSNGLSEVTLGVISKTAILIGPRKIRIDCDGFGVV